MSVVLIFRPEVREELNETYNWYEEQQPGLGDDFLDCVDELINRIQRMPELYAVVHRDVRRAVVRRFPYAIYYRMVFDRVIVLAVLHGRGDPNVWQTRT